MEKEALGVGVAYGREIGSELAPLGAQRPETSSGGNTDCLAHWRVEGGEEGK